MLITIKPFRRHFYESLLNFEPLENRVVENYAFSNGATVMAEYLDLGLAPEKYKKIYNHLSDEKNLYKYFTQTQISNFQFPERHYNTISDPVMTPELLHYFFVEKIPILEQMSAYELSILKNIYSGSDYDYLFKNFSNKINGIQFARGESRFEIKSKAILYSNYESEPDQIVKVYNVSRDGLMLYSSRNIQLNKVYRIKTTLSQESQSFLEITAKWKNGLGMYGFEIHRSDVQWDLFIDYLQDQQLNVCRNTNLIKKERIA